MVMQPPSSPGLAARLFGADERRTLALLRASWPLAVGPALARRTEVVALEGKTLRVRVPDAGWRTVLHRLQPAILQRLREMAGGLAPRRLGFMEGPVAPAAPPVALSVAPVPGPAPTLVVEEAARIEDPVLRERFLESAARYLARKKRGADHA